MVSRGEVWWVDHPAHGRRPFLVLTRQAVIPLVNKVTGVPAAKRVRVIPSEVPLSREDGMPADCVLSFDNLTLLRKSWFVEPICQLSPVRMVEVPGAVGGHGVLTGGSHRSSIPARQRPGLAGVSSPV